MSYMNDFNKTAAGVVYISNSSAYDANGQKLGALGVILNQNALDADKTIRNSSIDTNLKAIQAGFKGTPHQNKIDGFIDAINKHGDKDNLKTNLAAAMKDEGAGMMNALADLATGNGSLTPAQLNEYLSDPTKRKLLSDTLQRVSTADYTARDGVDLINKAVAAKDGDNKKVNEFLDQAKKMNIDTSGLQQDEMMKMLKEVWTNPSQGIAKFLDKIDMPQDFKEGLTGFLSKIAEFYKDVLNYYINGENGQPGLRQIFANAVEVNKDDGRKIRAEAGIPAPAQSAEPTVPAVDQQREPLVRPQAAGPAL